MKTDTIPKVTHAQYLVLSILARGAAVPGQVLHEQLTKAEACIDRTAFYQLMRRMTEAGLVKGEYVQREIDSALSAKPRLYRFRNYTITLKGQKERDAALQFYAQAAA